MALSLRKHKVFLLFTVLFTILLISATSCATKKPALYTESGEPFSITDYEKIAQKEFDEDRYLNAVDAYQAIIDNYPDNVNAMVWAHYEIGFCHWMKKDYDKAGFYFRKVVNEYQDPAAKKLANMMLQKISNTQK